MRKIVQVLFLMNLFAASGCVLTLNSLFASKDVIYDPALEGVWKAEGATWTLRPFDAKGGRYRLQTEMKDQPTERWYCTLGMVGTNRFLELLPQRPSEIHPKTFFGGHFTELRSFWKVALIGDTLTLTSMSSQWLDAKAAGNRRKHGISFEEAATVFADENGRLKHDPDHSKQEDRFLLLGFSAKLRLLLVCHAYRENDEVIRGISARKATRNERKQYGSYS